MIVLAGTSSASFIVTASSILTSQTATVTATSSGVSKSAAIALQSAPVPPPVPTTITSVQCATAVLDAGKTTSCTVKLSGIVTASIVITLGSSNLAITVPVNATVPVGASEIAFTATGGTVTSTQSTVITASTATASSATTTISVAPPISAGGRLFYLAGETSELSGTTRGSIVTPATGPAGSLVVAGSGSVNFAPAKVGNGVSFLQGGQQNQNTAFYAFKGTQVGKVFNLASGSISFSMKSRYSFARRQALPQSNYRWVYDVFDESNRLHSFYLGTSGARLIFWFQTGSNATQYYFVPAGQEDALFGSGVILDVKLTWNGTSNSLYLNGSLVSKQPYSKTAANWTANSSFSIGGTDVRLYGGGHYSFDDILDEFQISDTLQSAPITLQKPAVTGLMNAASQSADNACSPGSIARVVGTGFTGGSAYSDSSGLSTQLGAARVNVNGSYAKLISVSDKQVEFLCPDVAPAMLVNVSLENQEGLSDPVTTTMQRAAPGIFSVHQLGSRAGIAAGTADLQQTESSTKFVIRATGLRSLKELPSAQLMVSLNGELVKAEELRTGDEPGIDEVVVSSPASALQNQPLVIRINITYGDGQVVESNEFAFASKLEAGR